MKISNDIIDELEFIDSVAAAHYKLKFILVPEELFSRRAIKNSNYIYADKLGVLYIPFIKDNMPVLFGGSYKSENVKDSGLEIKDERFIHLIKNYEKI